VLLDGLETHHAAVAVHRGVRARTPGIENAGINRTGIERFEGAVTGWVTG
jgi:hypothetical protein